MAFRLVGQHHFGPLLLSLLCGTARCGRHHVPVVENAQGGVQKWANMGQIKKKPWKENGCYIHIYIYICVCMYLLVQICF